MTESEIPATEAVVSDTFMYDFAEELAAAPAEERPRFRGPDGNAYSMKLLQDLTPDEESTFRWLLQRYSDADSLIGKAKNRATAVKAGRDTTRIGERIIQIGTNMPSAQLKLMRPDQKRRLFLAVIGMRPDTEESADDAEADEAPAFPDDAEGD